MRRITIVTLLTVLLIPFAARAGDEDLTDPSARVRLKAVQELGEGRADAAAAIALLAIALNDDSPEVRAAALCALAAVGVKGAPAGEARLAEFATRGDAV